MLYSSNDPDSCLLIAEKGIALTKNKSCEKYLPSLLKLKGVAFVNKGEYKQSAEEYFKALAEAEKQDNKKEIAAIYNNLGVNFWYQKDYKNALKYHTEALKQRQNLNIPKEIAKSYNNLGTVEVDMGNYKDAVEHYMMALKIKDSIGDVIGIANGNNNLGIVYERMNRLDDANTAYKKALKIFKQEGDKRGEVVTLNNIAAIDKSQGKYNDAFQLGKEALALGKELNDMEDLKMSYEVLAASSFHLGKHKDAYEYLEKYVALNDSLTSSNNFQTVQELEKKYNTEKQQQEIILLQQSNLIQEIELSRAETQKKSLLIIILLALIVISLAAFAFIKISRQKKDLEENKSNIEIQNSQLELQKKEIVDSINYAKRIQDAMLKDEEHTSMHLPPHFILFKPKDIVSGDFYWALEKENYLYFAAADCTGHGVPGAFLTLLGTSFLNEINATEKILTPAQILDQLRDKIVKELSSNQEKTRDGMDISMIRVDLKNLEAVWAGAYNPLWISKESDPGNLIEIQADKQSVGYSEEQKNFSDHSFKLNSGDQIYLFTDGFADQFGGQSGKKFKYKQLKNLLADLRKKPIDDQKKELNSTFETWRGKLEQVDDVLIVGMKF
jgi:serine phosphatase RsbU (regulator of sigma subunit)/Flp pilus assembly protein TadD